MEPELKFEELSGFDILARETQTHEETMEASLPDYCASVSRVIDTAGQVLVQEISPGEGRLRGEVRVSVLYVSEEAEGLQSATVAVPFVCELVEKRLRECRLLQVYSRLLLCEGKIVTGRKLYVRVIGEFTVRGIGAVSWRICANAEGAGLQLRWQQTEISVLKGAIQRECSIHQEFTPDGMTEIPEEILTERLYPRVISSQQIGNKLVVKGEIRLCGMVRQQDRKLGRMDMTLPFSQILDGTAFPEGGKIWVRACVAQWELRLLRSEGSCSLTARLTLQAFCTEKQSLRWVSDLYSTEETLTVSDRNMSISQLEAPVFHEAAAEETLEFGSKTPFVYLTGCDCGVPVCREDGAAVTPVRLRLLYIDEEGAPATVERSREVVTPVEEKPSFLWAENGPAELQSGAGRYSLRLPVWMQAAYMKPSDVCSVVSVQAEKEAEERRRPSLVLRRPKHGESLWDIAKAHRSSEEAIRKLNHMEGEELPEGMLLIPTVHTADRQ